MGRTAGIDIAERAGGRLLNGLGLSAVFGRSWRCVQTNSDGRVVEVCMNRGMIWVRPNQVPIYMLAPLVVMLAVAGVMWGVIVIMTVV